MNRPLLHAEELEGKIIAEGPVCTCRSDARCPMCGAAEADAGCAVHDGHELAAVMKELAEREPTDEELDARLEELDLDALLDGKEPSEVLDHLCKKDKASITDWIAGEIGLTGRHVSADDLLGMLEGSAILAHLESEHAELLEEWAREHVELELTTDDLGNKVPGIKGVS